jgi:PII-like signaling protein
MGLAGATVVRGLAGYGAHSRLHTAKVLRLSEDLPLVIEIVDREDRIRAFLPACDEMIREGLVTLERVEILKYEAPSPVDRA